MLQGNLWIWVHWVDDLADSDQLSGLQPTT